MQLSERQLRLLQLIIDEYVSSAEPVSSKLVEESGIFHLSSATIRSEMNELERQGYLEQPHTSAGRIPTDKAYRLYVNALVKSGKIEPETRLRQKVKTGVSELGRTRDPHTINRGLAQLLSELSDQLVITNMDREQEFFKVGLSSLFSSPEFREIDRIFNVTSVFDEFEQLFDRMMSDMAATVQHAQTIRVFIGSENPIRRIRDESVIVSSYQLPNNRRGTLTMIGPMRMNYGRNIGLVRYAVHEVNKISSPQDHE